MSKIKETSQQIAKFKSFSVEKIVSSAEDKSKNNSKDEVLLVSQRKKSRNNSLRELNLFSSNKQLK